MATYKQPDELVIENLFPEYISSSKELSSLVKITSSELAKLFTYTELFPNLFSAYNVPTEYVDSLANTLGYSKIEGVTEKYQRDIILRLTYLYKSRGTEQDLLNYCRYSSSESYLGGDLFIPESFISDKAVEIEYPRDSMFRHSKHGRSTTFRYPDPTTYMDGIFLIKITNLSNPVKKRVLEQVPAGIKVVFNETINLKSTYHEYNIPSTLIVDKVDYFGYDDASHGYSNAWLSTGLPDFIVMTYDSETKGYDRATWAE